MTKLLALCAQLSDLRRRRQWARWGMAYTALTLAAMWMLAFAFAVDFAIELTRPQRLVMLIVFAGVVAWAWRRYARPWFGHRETDLDMALIVEKQQKIDSDLVAALQFEMPEARAWGSTSLEGAVVDYVAEFGKSWNVFEGFSRREVSRRGALLAVTVVGFVLLAIAAPRYFGAFMNRFLLGSAHYPSATEIDRVLVNGRELDVRPGADAVFKAPYGQPLRIVVETSGVLPDSGRADLRAVASGLETRLELEQDASQPKSETPASPSETAHGHGRFAGQLSKLTDSLACQLYLGDAWTDPARLLVVPLPVIEPRFRATPPAYARGVAVENSAGSRQLAVIEGSRIDAGLACGNKRLAEAWVVIDNVKYPLAKLPSATPMAASDGEAAARPEEVWSLAIEKTPLARVEKPLRWEAQVIDEDGLSLEHPLEGFIRIKLDQRPRIAADVVTKFVLPTAGPRIEYRATDDFGLSKVLARLERIGQDGSAQALPALVVRDFRQPLLGASLPLKGSYPLDLSPLKLVKGDQLKVVLEAIDYRGSTPGQSSQSEPLMLQVTDESGVLAAISEADERSARQLDAIITRQLGIGDQK